MPRYLLLLLLLPVLTFAQNKFPVTNVVALRNGNPMQNAWVGGLNNPVFSEIDANHDGLMDLFIYDKAGWKAMIFLNTGSVGHPSFTYAPEYDRMFPIELRDWAVLRDYNHDGVMDIFAVNSNPGITVYKGYELADGFLGYNQTYSNLTYMSGPSSAPVWTFPDNMPVIMDINGDGDLDILAPDIAGGISLDYYQNQAVDLGYSGDSLNFTIGSTCADQTWGGFLEDIYDCGVTLANCKKELNIGSGGTIAGSRHQGGACCGFRYRNNSTVSLLLSDILCPTVKFLENGGDSSAANIVRDDSIFPRYDVPVYMPIFPCSYIVDANNDGYDDLFVSPFASNANQEGQAEDIKVVWYYKNIGIDSVNKFQYQGDSMLTNGVIDVGTESHPVFFDYDGDGLMDIVTGAYGRFQATGFPKSALALYRNVGTSTVPQYQETNLNWNNLSAYQILGIYPAFGDLDGDGHPDMVVGDLYGNISFFHNNGTTTASYPSMTNPNWFGINVGANAAPFLYDVNGDSLLDIVIGSKNNNIMYFWNFGTKTTPMFSPDSLNASFGNIRVLDQHTGGTPFGYATPFITVEGGNTYLYSGSQRGLTFKYLINPDSLRRGTFATIDTNFLGTKPGLRSTINIADINGDGINDYITGNIRGGLNLYSDVNWGNVPVISSIVEPVADRSQLQVYPNPARDKVICHMINSTSTLVNVSLYDMLGELVPAPFTKGADNTLTISVDAVANGIYVIQARDASGRVYQHKISIFK